MAGYIPWFGKKRVKLAEHEREFITVLKTDASAIALAERAEQVCAAQVRALRAKLRSVTSFGEEY